jgi:hypothetical protein
LNQVLSCRLLKHPSRFKVKIRLPTAGPV